MLTRTVRNRPDSRTGVLAFTPAQNVPDLMLAGNAQAQEPVNACVRVALAYRDFVRAVVRDNLQVAAGKALVNAYVNPNGREGDGSSKVKTYPTEIVPNDVRKATDRLLTLSKLAHRVRSDQDILDIVERKARAIMAEIAGMDRALWDAWTTNEKAHMPACEAAILDVDGFAWTSSQKGHATTIRYDDTAQGHDRAHKSAHAYMGAAAYLSERDIAS